MMNVTIQQEDLTILHIYASNIGALRFLSQVLLGLQKDIDNQTIIMGALDRSSR